jgi:hypothetical protein
VVSNNSVSRKIARAEIAGNQTHVPTNTYSGRIHPPVRPVFPGLCGVRDLAQQRGQGAGGLPAAAAPGSERQRHSAPAFPSGTIGDAMITSDLNRAG